MKKPKKRVKDARRGATLRRIAVLCAMAAAVSVPAPSWSGSSYSGTPAGLGFASDRLGAILSHHPLRTLDGRQVSLQSLRGEVVVINFWASWCPPCRRELPRLDALHKEISKRGGQVLAVSIDHDLENVRRFVRRHGLTLPICHDGPGGLARQLDLKNVPLTVVLDRGGQIAFTTHESDRQALDQLTASTRQLLASERPESPSASEESR